jgi:hypothetical protein
MSGAQPRRSCTVCAFMVESPSVEIENSRTISLPPNGRTVLGADLNCSESRRALPTPCAAPNPMRQETAALRDFGPAYDRCGSSATEEVEAQRPRMSALPPIVLQKSPSRLCEIEICNNRIGASVLLNRYCSFVPDLESMFRDQMSKILLQHNPPKSGYAAHGATSRSAMSRPHRRKALV